MLTSMIVTITMTAATLTVQFCYCYYFYYNLDFCEFQILSQVVLTHLLSDLHKQPASVFGFLTTNRRGNRGSER